MTPQVSDQDRDDAYRAVGRYVVEFSRLVMHMRHRIEYKLDHGSGDKLAAYALGGASADQITDAFFALCETVADLNKEEKRVGARLRKEVRDEIKRRNDFAHGDWSIGEAAIADDPVLYRVKPGRKDGASQIKHLPIADIDAASDGLHVLRQKVAEYGAICLGGFPMSLPDGAQWQVSHAFKMDSHEVVRKNPVAINWL